VYATAILRIAGEGSQAGEGCEADCSGTTSKHAIRVRWMSIRVRKTHGKDLVRPDAGVRRAAIDNMKRHLLFSFPEKVD